MMRLLLPLTLVAGAAHAEVIECPAQQAGARLLGAGMYEGKNKEAELIGDRKQMRNGQDIDFGFNGGEVKWVVCWYKPATPRWHQVSLEARHCALKERTSRQGKVSAKVICK